MKYLTRLAAAMGLAALLFALVGCDTTENAAEEPPTPAPLSAELFQIQTDLFKPGGGKVETKAHFTAAALRVWPVSLILSANLVLPFAVTAAALTDQPSFEDGAWHWSATTQSGTDPYTFTLIAEPTIEGFDWTMRITGNDPFTGSKIEEFDLYTAQTSFDGTMGSWQLYYRVNGARTNVLNATVDFSTTNKMLHFSIPEPFENAGDMVHYEVENDARRFLWQQVAEGFDHDVGWDAVTKEGSIVATNYNGGVEGCWDGNLEDVACDN